MNNLIRKILWIFFPVAFYFLDFYGPVYQIAILTPYLIYGSIYIYSSKVKLNKAYVILYLYISSIVLSAYLTDYLGSVFTLVALSIYIFSLKCTLTSYESIESFLRYVCAGFIIIIMYHINVYLSFGGEFEIYGFRVIDSMDMERSNIREYIHSSIDGPLLISMFLSISLFNYKFKPEYFRQKVGMKIFNAIIVGILIATSIYILLVYNRRLLLALVVLLVILYLLNAYKMNAIYKYSVFLPYLGIVGLLLILFWINLTEYSFLQNLFIRTQDLSEDNDRIIAWFNAFDAFSKIRIEDFFIYEKELVVVSGKPWISHFHNGILQVIYERGIFGFITLNLLFYELFKAFKKMSPISRVSNTLKFIFIIIFVNSITESSFRYSNIDNVLFITFTACLFSYKQMNVSKFGN